MTEKIQKAIDKIDQEAEKMGSATVRLLCSMEIGRAHV